MAASGVTPDANANGYGAKVRGPCTPGGHWTRFFWGGGTLILLPSQKETLSDKERWQHLADLADFALAMKVTLMNINYQSFNNFMLRIGKSGGFPRAHPDVPSVPQRGDGHPALLAQA